MKKVLFFVVSLFLAVGVMAQIDTKKEYRIKSKSVSNYLTIGEASSNQYGQVYGADKSENQDQIFKFVDAGSGQYYVKSISGKYFSYYGTNAAPKAGWNVNYTTVEDKAFALTFESAGENVYKIKC